MAALLEKCPHCGIDVMFMGETCPNCHANKNADAGTVATERLEVTVTAAKSSIDQRPVSATIPRLLLGAIILSVTIFLGVLFAPDVSFMGHLGCLVGLGIVTGIVFKNADALDKQRWKRYWKGDLLGYAVCYVALLINTKPGSTASELTMIYVYACAAGFCVGLCNVHWTDKRDKAAIIEKLRHLAELEAQKTNAAAQE